MTKQGGAGGGPGRTHLPLISTSASPSADPPPLFLSWGCKGGNGAWEPAGVKNISAGCTIFLLLDHLPWHSANHVPWMHVYANVDSSFFFFGSVQSSKHSRRLTTEYFLSPWCFIPSFRVHTPPCRAVRRGAAEPSLSDITEKCYLETSTPSTMTNFAEGSGVRASTCTVPCVPLWCRQKTAKPWGARRDQILDADSPPPPLSAGFLVGTCRTMGAEGAPRKICLN